MRTLQQGIRTGLSHRDRLVYPVGISAKSLRLAQPCSLLFLTSSSRPRDLCCRRLPILRPTLLTSTSMMASTRGNIRWATSSQNLLYGSSGTTVSSQTIPSLAVGRPSELLTALGGYCEPLDVSRSWRGRNEFDGATQSPPKPSDGGYEPKEEELPQLPIHLYAQEQDDILANVNDRLSQCAFDFVAKYQFPIPIEPDKRRVRVPSDREWVHLLKRLATKRRIPARVLYNGQIKQLITTLQNSLEMRHAAKHPAMQYLDSLYTQADVTPQGSRRMGLRCNTLTRFIDRSIH